MSKNRIRVALLVLAVVIGAVWYFNFSTSADPERVAQATFRAVMSGDGVVVRSYASNDNPVKDLLLNPTVLFLVKVQEQLQGEVAIERMGTKVVYRAPDSAFVMFDVTFRSVARNEWNESLSGEKTCDRQYVIYLKKTGFVWRWTKIEDISLSPR